MRVFLIGCVKSSEIFLKRLIEMDADVAGVITKSESKFNSDFVDLGEICRNHKIDYLYVHNINDREAKDYIKEKDVDLILCLGWSQLLDEEVLALPRLGCVGFHPAQLPFNRGRHPLIWALALGLEQTASTLFLMDATADTGKIISQKVIEIAYSDDAESLYHKVMDAAVDQLTEVMHDFENHTLNVIEQSAGEGNAWRKRGKEDGRIDWRMSSKSVYNLVRALTKPYVGAHFLHEDREYKVWKVQERFEKGYENIEPGKVVRVISDNNFWVKAGDNLIEVMECDSIKLKNGEYL
ncbi:MAG: methionyl-tRNA formyltransferase [Lachnospiraceae bacterium]|nr:methionyl-tRNA formyltransferase [Lachnospiraceae bacterium]